MLCCVSSDGTGPDAAAHRDEAPQWVLPLVVRIERAPPPTRTDALEAAARAVLVFLNDPRSVEGEWADAVRAWEDGRIRKVVRRARGAGWQRAVKLPGITVTHGTAEVRIYPPVPVDGWPEELARLQVGGTDLADESPPGDPGAGIPVLWLNPTIEMTAGKAMAQVGHAAQLAWWRLPDGARAKWRDRGFDLAVRTASPERWATLLTSDLPVVRDGGFTEVAPGTCTVVADHPALRQLSRRLCHAGVITWRRVERRRPDGWCLHKPWLYRGGPGPERWASRLRRARAEHRRSLRPRRREALRALRPSDRGRAGGPPAG
jgi:peptidyl-tRNA hydrolase